MRDPMTGPDFAALAASIWGTHWRKPCAAALGVHEGTVDAWAKGRRRVPVSVTAYLEAVQAASARVTVPPAGSVEAVAMAAKLRRGD